MQCAWLSRSYKYKHNIQLMLLLSVGLQHVTRNMHGCRDLTNNNYINIHSLCYYYLFVVCNVHGSHDRGLLT